MADTRLSDLSAAGALSASDLFYVVQTPGSGGEKATGTQLLTLVGTSYVPLAGGTMTGALTLPAGSVAAPSLMFTGAGATTGIYSSAANEVSVAISGAQRLIVSSSGVYALTNTLGMSVDTGYISLGASNDIRFYRDAAATLAQRNGTTQQIFRLYNTADAGLANYERLTLTGVAGTSVNITAETLGTGGDNLDIVLTPAGTGGVVLPGGTQYFGAAANSLYLNAQTAYSLGLHCGTLAGHANYLFSATDLKFGEGSVEFVVAIPAASSGKALGLKSTVPVAWSSSDATSTASSNDAGLMRGAAGQVDVTNGTAATYRDLKLRNLLQTEYQQMTEMTAPSAPATNSVRIYAEDNGSGKTRLMALFATGAAQQIAIEP